MNQRVLVARKVTAGLFVILGAVIAGRGVVEAAPLSFTALGLLMLVLGAYRLRLVQRLAKGGR